MAVFLLAPPAPFIPEELHGKRVLAIIVRYIGDVVEEGRLLGPVVPTIAWRYLIKHLPSIKRRRGAAPNCRLI